MMKMLRPTGLALVSLFAAAQGDGDFTQINSLLENVVLQLNPNVEIPLILFAIELNQEGTCSGVTVQDIQINAIDVSPQEYKIDVAATGLTLECSFPAIRDPLIGSNQEGFVNISSQDISFRTVIVLESEDFSVVGPTSTKIDDTLTCDEQLDVSLVVNSDLINNDLINGFVDAFLPTQKQLLCDQVQVLGAELGALLVDISMMATVPTTSASEQALESEMVAKQAYDIDFLPARDIEDTIIRARSIITDLGAFVSRFGNMTLEELLVELTSGDPIQVPGIGNVTVPQELVDRLDSVEDLGNLPLIDLLTSFGIPALVGFSVELDQFFELTLFEVTELRTEFDLSVDPSRAWLDYFLDLIPLNNYLIDTEAEVRRLLKQVNITLPVIDFGNITTTSTFGDLLDFVEDQLSVSNSTNDGTDSFFNNGTFTIPPEILIQATTIVADALEGVIPGEIGAIVDSVLIPVLRSATDFETFVENLTQIAVGLQEELMRTVSDLIKALLVVNIDLGENGVLGIGLEQLDITTTPFPSPDASFSVSSNHSIVTPVGAINDVVFNISARIDASVTVPEVSTFPLLFSEVLSFTLSWSGIQAQAALLLGYDIELFDFIDENQDNLVECLVGSSYANVTGLTISSENIGLSIEGATDGIVVTTAALINSLFPLYRTIFPKIVQGTLQSLLSTTAFLAPNNACFPTSAPTQPEPTSSPTSTIPPSISTTEPENTSSPTTTSAGSSEESDESDSSGALIGSLSAIGALALLAALVALRNKQKKRERRSSGNPAYGVEVADPEKQAKIENARVAS